MIKEYMESDYKRKRTLWRYIKENRILVYLFILGFAVTYWIRRAISLGIWN